MQRDGDDPAIDSAEADRIRRILSELEESDFERLEPPALIWEGIETSVTSQGESDPRKPARLPKEPPTRDAAARTLVEYWVDDHDVVTEVGDGWADFALGNDAPELAVPASDRTLWSYMDSDEVRELWQLLVHRVRALQSPARFSFRCDAHHTRRWFDMTITPESDGRVHFCSVLAFEEPRSPVALLDPHFRRDADALPVPVCSWCGRGQHGSDWIAIEELVRAGRLLEHDSVPPISYGICATCRSDMSAELLVPGVDRSIG